MAKYTIRFVESDETFTCGEDEFVLAAMFRTGRSPYRHGCYGGGCGICKMKVQSGRYEVAKRMSRAHISPEEEAQGIILGCCIQPREDLLLQKV